MGVFKSVVNCVTFDTTRAKKYKSVKVPFYNTVIFIFGLFVFILFVLGIIFNSKETKKDNSNRVEADTLDYDGSGNFGRIPNKKPKNRAN